MNGIRYDGLKDEIMDAKEGGEVDMRTRNLHLNRSTEECIVSSFSNDYDDEWDR
jgi:hypothetical protein